jgi:hypothetical protein
MMASADPVHYGLFGLDRRGPFDIVTPPVHRAILVILQRPQRGEGASANSSVDEDDRPGRFL